MGRKDYVGGGIFIALGIFIAATSFSFPELDGGHPGPSLFPRVLAILFIFFGGIVVLHGPALGQGENGGFPRRGRAPAE